MRGQVLIAHLDLGVVRALADLAGVIGPGDRIARRAAKADRNIARLSCLFPRLEGNSPRTEDKLAPERWAANLQGIIRPEIVSDSGVAGSMGKFCREVSNWYLGASNALSSFDKWHRAGVTLALLATERDDDLARNRLLHNTGMRLYRTRDTGALSVFTECHDFFLSRDHPRQFRLSDETAENLLLIHILNNDAGKAGEMFDLLAQRPKTDLNFWSEVGLQVTEALFFDVFCGKSERTRVSRYLERAERLHRRCHIRLEPVLHLPVDNALDRFINQPDCDRFEIFKAYRQPTLEIGENFPIHHEFESIYNALHETLKEVKAPIGRECEG
jgi:hypothetical protein